MAATGRELRKQAIQAHRDGRLNEALGLYFDALEGGKGSDVSDILGNIGGLYFELGETTNAQKFLEKGLREAKAHSNAVTASAINRYLGRVLRHQGKLQEAIGCLKESERLLKGLNQEEKLLSTVLALGETYLELRQRLEAEQYLLKAQDLALRHADKARLRRARELLDQIKEIDTLDTLAMAEISAMTQERSSMAKLQEINVAINSRLPLTSLLELIVDKAITLCNAGRGMLVLSGPGGPHLKVARAAGGAPLDGGLERLSPTVLERLLMGREPLLVESVGEHPSLATRRSVLESGAESILAVPLKRADACLGFLYLDAPSGTTRFSPSDLETLAIFAVQATIAMETAELLEENSRQKAALEDANLQLSAKVSTQYREIGALRSNLENLQGRGSARAHARILGQSPRLRQCLAVMERVADTPLNVILEGESGTGKELFAQALHTTSSRRSQNFVAENIAAIPRDLMESVLFGHVQGAFTGATANRDGLFTLAHKGTLFLDEIGEMPPELQASLLRVLQEGEVRPVGSPGSLKVDVRVIAATHRRLRDEVEAGRFRADLWHRLNGITLEIPALRDREGDVDMLLAHFLGAHPGLEVEPETAALLRRLPWPGNVRQLKNEVERWAALGLRRVTSQDLSPGLGGPASPIISGLQWQGRPLKDVVQEAVDLVEREVVLAVLEKNRGRKVATARELDISRPTLDVKIRKLGLRPAADPDEGAKEPTS